MTNTSTVQSLRAAGYKVRVHHWRYTQDDNSPLVPMHEFHTTVWMSPKGGKTVVAITTPSGENFAGQALCSRLDNFNRKLGVQIAIGRALATVVTCPPTCLTSVVQSIWRTSITA